MSSDVDNRNKTDIFQNWQGCCCRAHARQCCLQGLPSLRRDLWPGEGAGLWQQSAAQWQDRDVVLTLYVLNQYYRDFTLPCCYGFESCMALGEHKKNDNTQNKECDNPAPTCGCATDAVWMMSGYQCCTPCVPEASREDFNNSALSQCPTLHWHLHSPGTESGQELKKTRRASINVYKESSQNIKVRNKVQLHRCIHHFRSFLRTCNAAYSVVRSQCPQLFSRRAKWQGKREYWRSISSAPKGTALWRCTSMSALVPFSCQLRVFVHPALHTLLPCVRWHNNLLTDVVSQASELICVACNPEKRKMICTPHLFFFLHASCS